MKNWKTTLGGAMTAIGLTLKNHGSQSFEYWIGELLEIAGPLVIGLTAKDHDVTGANETKIK